MLTYLLTEKQKAQIAFIINDKPGDGTDISWLWDVDFEKLEKFRKTYRCSMPRESVEKIWL